MTELEDPTPPPTHAAVCAAVVAELKGHYTRLNKLLDLLTTAAEDAAGRGRHQALAELSRTAVTVQAGAARALAGIMSVESEGRLAVAALGRGGPRGPLIEVGGDS